MNITWPDGSTIWLKGSGSTLAEGNKAELKNAGVIAAGTGKFGAQTGARLQTALAAGAELYTDVVITIKK